MSEFNDVACVIISCLVLKAFVLNEKALKF